MKKLVNFSKVFFVIYPILMGYLFLDSVHLSSILLMFLTLSVIALYFIDIIIDKAQKKTFNFILEKYGFSPSELKWCILNSYYWFFINDNKYIKEYVENSEPNVQITNKQLRFILELIGTKIKDSDISNMAEYLKRLNPNKSDADCWLEAEHIIILENFK